MADVCCCERQEAELEAALFGTSDAIEGFGLEAAAPAPVWLDDDDEAAPDEAPSAAAAGGAVALWEDRRGDARAAGWVALRLHVVWDLRTPYLVCSTAWAQVIRLQVQCVPAGITDVVALIR